MTKEEKETKDKSEVSSLNNTSHYIFMNKNRKVRGVKDKSCSGYV